MEKIGRKVERMIMVDTVEDAKNRNLLLVSSWKGEQGDAQLAEICPLLAVIPVKQLSTL